MAAEIYCIDASSLIKLKQDFPRAVFPAVWERVEQLVAAGRLIDYTGSTYGSPGSQFAAASVRCRPTT
jgi:hypothetical protein